MPGQAAQASQAVGEPGHLGKSGSQAEPAKQLILYSNRQFVNIAHSHTHIFLKFCFDWFLGGWDWGVVKAWTKAKEPKNHLV